MATCHQKNPWAHMVGTPNGRVGFTPPVFDVFGSQMVSCFEKFDVGMSGFLSVQVFTHLVTKCVITHDEVQPLSPNPKDNTIP